MEFKLYSYYRSSSAYRVRIALNYKDINYTYLPIHLIENGGEQNSESYLKVNPKKEVPSLIHNENPISQSMAIVEYLDEIRPKKKLFPEDRLQRALVRQACEIINSGIQPLQNLKILNKLAHDFKATDAQKKNWISDVVHEGLTAFEKFISNKSGTYCFGDNFTAADVFLIPQIFSGARFGVDMSNYKILTRINETCLKLEFIQKAHPDHQPDTPKS